MSTLAKIGEFGLIERFRKLIKLDSSVIKGSGDDCAVIRHSRDQYLLFTCDMIVEGVDFLAYHHPGLIGRKALAISISDIAACGGIARYCVVSLGLPKKISPARVMRLAEGMLNLAREYDINVVGGDISRAPVLTIDVSMIGFVKREHLALRNAAKKGDIIFTTGPLGGSIRGKHFNFIPRVREARFLTADFKIHAMIDISDGLAQDLGHILSASGVGAAIYESLIPVSAQAHGLREALYMGEDFELLFTLSRKDAARLMRQKKYKFFPLGEILDKKYGLKLLDAKGREKKIQPEGYRHF